MRDHLWLCYPVPTPSKSPVAPWPFRYCSVTSDSLWLHGPQHARLLCPPLSPSWLKFKSTESVMPSYHLILCCPILLLPSIFLSIRVFSNELARLIRWPNDWTFNFSISPSNAYSGLISFRSDWFDLADLPGHYPWDKISPHQLGFQGSWWYNHHLPSSFIPWSCPGPQLCGCTKAVTWAWNTFPPS